MHPERVLWILIALATITLFAMSTFRHYALRSGAFDLGFFDQAVYLISIGQTPISSLHDFHVLADHGSLILYPLALFYLIWADPHMLLAIQAAALALGAWPIWRMARLSGLSSDLSIGVACAYLMYPLVLTSNLFDFHPDVLAVPAMLMAVLAAREDRRIAFCIWLLVAMSCKEVIALTIIAMGFWLLIFERRKFHGLVAILGGAAWFVFVVKVLIPWFGDGRSPSGTVYYAYLGDSIGEIIVSMIRNPLVVLQRIFSIDGIKYVAMVLLPVAWGLHYKTLTPLLAAAPAVLLNLLSENASQRSPFFQYSLPVVPFVFITLILTMSLKVAWFKHGRSIIIWSVALLALGGVARLGKTARQQGLDWASLDHTKAAAKQIDPSAKVLTTFETVPHLSRRQTIQYVGGVGIKRPLEFYDYILISTRHSSLQSTDNEGAKGLYARIILSKAFHLEYTAPNVFLFKRIDPPVFQAAAGEVAAFMARSPQLPIPQASRPARAGS